MTRLFHHFQRRWNRTYCYKTSTEINVLIVDLITYIFFFAFGVVVVVVIVGGHGVK